MSNNIIFIGDWSNLSRGSRSAYKIGEYSKVDGFRRLKEFLCDIGQLTRYDMYTPRHDVEGHFQFLRDQGITIVLCPVKDATQEDTTDPKLISDALDLVENYNMQYICIGSGDHHFLPILKAAKAKGIKVAIVYGSEKSLSYYIREMADEYPQNHPKKGQKMLHHFSPVKKIVKQRRLG